MRQVFIRTIVKGITALIGILLISTGLQLMIRFRGVELLISEIREPMSEAYPGEGEELRKQAVDYIHKLMGLDRLFVPDVWPFDNQSLWHKSKPESR